MIISRLKCWLLAQQLCSQILTDLSKNAIDDALDKDQRPCKSKLLSTIIPSCAARVRQTGLKEGLLKTPLQENWPAWTNNFHYKKKLYKINNFFLFIYHLFWRFQFRLIPKTAGLVMPAVSNTNTDCKNYVLSNMICGPLMGNTPGVK